MQLRWIADREGKLLSFLRRELALSSGLCKRLKYEHAFAVNGRAVYTDFLVHPGDEITVCLQESEPEFPAEPGELRILYEDEALLALDKPAGLMVHPSAARNTGTLANRVLWYYRESGQACRFHPVTRLDRDTLGVVLLAKNAHIHARLMEALKAGALHKIYEAWVYSGPEAECGEIDAPIARENPLRMLRVVRGDGKPALTRYTVLRRAGDRTLLRLEPVTGRTHQLRVHCLYSGFPILGDPQYFTPESAACSAALGLQTQQLCAAELRLAHPLSGEPLVLQSAQGYSGQSTTESADSTLDFSKQV